jgi:DNA-binding MarR family transcriptional regulator
LETVVNDTAVMGKSRSSKTVVSELKSHAGFWLRFVSNHVSNAFARRLQDSGVTAAEWVVLRQMYDQEQLSPSVLADSIGMTRGAASKLIDRLLDKALITREGRSDDRRFQNIGLTPAGRKLVPALAAIADQNDEEFFAPLSVKEQEALVATLKTLAQAHGLRKLPTE